ncbi:MAG: hypothetical protein ACYC41_02490 [Bacillota bacterium]
MRRRVSDVSLANYLYYVNKPIITGKDQVEVIKTAPLLDLESKLDYTFRFVVHFSSVWAPPPAEVLEKPKRRLIPRLQME